MIKRLSQAVQNAVLQEEPREGPTEASVYKDLFVDMQVSQLHVIREYQSLFKEKEEEILRLKAQLGETLPASESTSSATTTNVVTPGKSAMREMSPEDLKVVLKEWERKMKSNITAKSEAMAEALMYRQTAEMFQKEAQELKEIISKDRKAAQGNFKTDNEREEHAQAMVKLGEEFAVLKKELELAQKQLKENPTLSQVKEQMEELVRLNAATEKELSDRLEKEVQKVKELSKRATTVTTSTVTDPAPLLEAQKEELNSYWKAELDKLQQAHASELDTLVQQQRQQWEIEAATSLARQKEEVNAHWKLEMDRVVEEHRTALEAMKGEADAQREAQNALSEESFRRQKEALEATWKEKMDTMEKSYQAQVQSEKEALTQEMTQQVNDAKKESVTLASQIAQLQKEHEVHLGRLEETRNELESLLQQERASIATLQTSHAEEVLALKERVHTMEGSLVTSEEHVAHFKQLFVKESALRRQVHDELMDLKGNIRVFARVRPMLESESGGESIPFDFEDQIMSVNNGQNKFEFDQMFDGTATQEHVFASVSPFIVSVMDGVNVTLFAYGQTGSGKTFTMQGSPENPGVNTRALAAVFQLAEARKESIQYVFTVSVLEVYLEQLLDLLSSDRSTNLDVRMHAETKSNYVPNLTKQRVETMEEVRQVISLANKNRTTASHNMNEHSSRSHLVFTLDCIGTSLVKKQASFEGHLTLIDLAGSERVSKTDASGDQLKEAQSINKSLSALGDVINALSAGQAHVPFRNSKLTYLLQDQLSGSSKVGFFANVNPTMSNLSETIYTLKFAERCRKTELKGRKETALTAENARLRKQVEELSRGGGVGVSPPPPKTSSSTSTAATPVKKRGLSEE